MNARALTRRKTWIVARGAAGFEFWRCEIRIAAQLADSKFARRIKTQTLLIQISVLRHCKCVVFDIPLVCIVLLYLARFHRRHGYAPAPHRILPCTAPAYATPLINQLQAQSSLRMYRARGCRHMSLRAELLGPLPARRKCWRIVCPQP